jgi:carbon storage regulator
MAARGFLAPNRHCIDLRGPMVSFVLNSLPNVGLVPELPYTMWVVMGEKQGSPDRFDYDRGVELGKEQTHQGSHEGEGEMLVLSRKLGEKICIGENICITVVDIDRGKIRLGIEAPRTVPVFRQELLPLKAGETAQVAAPALAQ